MGETCACGCEGKGLPVRYRCECGDECGCLQIEFEKEPDSVPHCCGTPMKRVE